MYLIKIIVILIHLVFYIQKKFGLKGIIFLRTKQNIAVPRNSYILYTSAVTMAAANNFGNLIEPEMNCRRWSPDGRVCISYDGLRYETILSVKVYVSIFSRHDEEA